MIGLDTNILVRAFLEDDASQARKAQQFMQKTSTEGKLFISSYAILEFVWVLKVKKFTRQDIYQAVITLIDSPGITVGQRDIVLSALEKFHRGQADFGDYMIWSEGQGQGAPSLKTFDQTFLSESSSITMPD